MRSSTASRLGWLTSTTVPWCQRGRGAPGGTADSAISVAPVPLLAPRVAQVVVAVALPEPAFVVIEQGDPADPLRGLPEVEMRHQESDGSAVLDRQRSVFVGPHEPGQVSAEVVERHVRRVARG